MSFAAVPGTSAPFRCVSRVSTGSENTEVYVKYQGSYFVCGVCRLHLSAWRMVVRVYVKPCLRATHLPIVAQCRRGTLLVTYHRRGRFGPWAFFPRGRKHQYHVWLQICKFESRSLKFLVIASRAPWTSLASHVQKADLLYFQAQKSTDSAFFFFTVANSWTHGKYSDGWHLKVLHKSKESVESLLSVSNAPRECKWDRNISKFATIMLIFTILKCPVFY